MIFEFWDGRDSRTRGLDWIQISFYRAVSSGMEGSSRYFFFKLDGNVFVLCRMYV